MLTSLIIRSGLDNAGKTTILKQLNGEDIKSVSPTLGFEIRTFAHKGSVSAALRRLAFKTRRAVDRS